MYYKNIALDDVDEKTYYENIALDIMKKHMKKTPHLKMQMKKQYYKNIVL